MNASCVDPGCALPIYFFLSRCRSGSSSLLQGLAASENIIVESEILNGIFPASYQRFLCSELQSRQAAQEQFLAQGPLFAFPAYIEHIILAQRERKPAAKAVIIETKIENLWVFSSQWVHPRLSSIGTIGVLHEMVGIAAGFYLLNRRDVLRRYASNILAEKTEVFHADGTDLSRRVGYDDAVAVDVPQFCLNAREEVLFDRELREYLSRFSRVRELIYEEVYLECGGFSDRFLEIVRVDMGVDCIAPGLPRLPEVPLDRVFSNVADVLAAMREDPLLVAYIAGC